MVYIYILKYNIKFYSVVLLCLMIFIPSSAEACGDSIVSRYGSGIYKRDLTSIDLARLRDIGPFIDDDPLRPVLSISPDGSKVAFELIAPDPISNQFCVSMVIAPLSGRGLPIVVDSGVDLIRRTLQSLGQAASPTGFAMVITPRWTADSRSIYFLKRNRGVTQIWRAAADGSGSEVVSHGTDDVDDFRISPDGKSVVFSTRPDLAVESTRIEEERKSGFHYDGRISPLVGDKPSVMNPIASEYFELDLVSGKSRPTNVERVNMSNLLLSGRLAGEIARASAPSGRVAILQRQGDIFPPKTNILIGDGASQYPCANGVCDGAGVPVWWIDAGQRIRFLRREGWADSATAIYEWKIGDPKAKRLFSTFDKLVECQPNGLDLICLQEGSLTPRRIIRLRPSSGQIHVLFDANPGFAGFKLGRVERLTFRNSFGIESFADFVFPTKFVRGKRYPLVIVQYRTRGFLGGGTGNEVPIQVLANQGFAVLSTENPSPAALLPLKGNSEVVDTEILKDFKGRRSILSSIETAVHLLADRGLIDDRIGISGLSDGSSTVQFAALNSTLFKVGSVGGCCWESNQDSVVGEKIAALYMRSGWPRLVDERPEFWSRMSIARNPERVGFPLLIQAADDEYLGSLMSFTALKQSGKPVDLFIFPDEKHVKWQPSHKLAVYERNVAWFKFWLKNEMPTGSRLQGEAERWKLMKH